MMTGVFIPSWKRPSGELSSAAGFAAEEGRGCFFCFFVQVLPLSARVLFFAFIAGAVLYGQRRFQSSPWFAMMFSGLVVHAACLSRPGVFRFLSRLSYAWPRS